MKANAPKRKVFNDAVDLLTGGEAAGADGIRMIKIKDIKPFHNHPFHLYEGERLDDMVESVKEHGILCPVIVQNKDNGFEMLAGHNRMNAARIAGLKEVPAIVKEGLTEQEAYVYVIETNMLQRSFGTTGAGTAAVLPTIRISAWRCASRPVLPIPAGRISRSLPGRWMRRRLVQ